MRGNHIGLALQGGGSYAAFTSGVLKALLNPRRRFLAGEDIRSISGTSGGALNAMLLGLALHRGLKNPVAYVDRLWEINRIENLLKDRFSHLKLVPDEVLAALVGMGRELMGAQPFLSSAMIAQGQLKSEALGLIDDMVREAAPDLPADRAAPLFPPRMPYVTVAATEVKSATAHYFTNNRRMIRKYERFEISKHRRVIRELSLLGVYASLAHPMVFDPVRIGDEMYWDGYYTCNPPFVYLFREGCDEVVLVRLVQQAREEIGSSVAEIKDRTEEIIQNTTINMEILAYLAMREIVLTNLGRGSGADLKLGLKKFGPAAVFHEIRLLKPGNISDEGYPLGDLVEKLIRLGEKVVTDRAGFIDTYEGADRGLQVISEIDFDGEQVRSRVVDIDKLLFEEQGGEVAEEMREKAGDFLRFFRELFD